MENNDARSRFIEILRGTKRENIEYIIEDLTDGGFLTAPASCQGHGAFPGGLLEHSLNVYDAAMAIRRDIIAARPDLEAHLPEDSIAITALLHDVCKMELYQLAKRKKRNEIGTYETVEQYEIHDEVFPFGHGEKSAVMILRSGLDLSDEELCAIRWHMGPWNLSGDDEKFYRRAGRNTPLVPLIHTADTIASAILERPVKTV